MFSATMLNCGIYPNLNVLSSVGISWCSLYFFNYKPFHKQFFCKTFYYYQLLYYNTSVNLSLKLLYVIYSTNALVKIYILIIIFKLGAFLYKLVLISHF